MITIMILITIMIIIIIIIIIITATIIITITRYAFFGLSAGYGSRRVPSVAVTGFQFPNRGS